LNQKKQKQKNHKPKHASVKESGPRGKKSSLGEGVKRT